MKISILGCGWLGWPLGEFLVKKGHEVRGSTTKTEKLELLKTAGIESYLIDIEPQMTSESLIDFLTANILIISFPPRLKMREPNYYVEQIKVLAEAIKKSSIEKIIFISSTSVYPDLNREVLEEDVTLPEQSASPDLVKAENLLQSLPQSLIILRCGGLMGYDRIPAKYFAGWKGLTTGGVAVNYIHRDDVIGIIYQLIEQNSKSETLNAVTPIHPLRKEIYEKNCQELGFEMPEFVEPKEPMPFKIISSKKLLEQLKYEFIYYNPLNFKYLA